MAIMLNHSRLSNHWKNLTCSHQKYHFTRFFLKNFLSFSKKKNASKITFKIEYTHHCIHGSLQYVFEILFKGKPTKGISRLAALWGTQKARVNLYSNFELEESSATARIKWIFHFSDFFSKRMHVLHTIDR